MLHTEDSSVLTGLAYTSDSGVELAVHVSSTGADFNSKVQIAPNIYVWTGTSTQHKVNTLRRFFTVFGADPTELTFYLKEQDDAKSRADGPERYSIRKKYWTVALPQIQERFGEGGTFSNVSPSTYNSIEGFYGVGGFNITCTANYDCARVQIWFGKSDKEKNKAAFDFVHSSKCEIEEMFGDELKWERLDEYKAATIIYELKGVSVANETDWIRMAKFHAEYSRKMCDTVLPVLKEMYPATELPKSI